MLFNGKLLKSIGIPYITLLDLDLERGGGGWGRVKYVLEQLIEAGISREEALLLSNGKLLTSHQFEEMHNRDYTESQMKLLSGWANRLEVFGVFFSSPLDLDFCLLDAYRSYYTAPASFPEGRGPSIPDATKDVAEFKEYLAAAIQATLKSKKATGELYSDAQKRDMIWYRYHFLGRGKPSTHIQVISDIPDDIFINNLPESIKKIFERIKKIM